MDGYISKRKTRVIFFILLNALIVSGITVRADGAAEVRAPRDTVNDSLAGCTPCVVDVDAIAASVACRLETIIENIIIENDACALIPLSQADMPATLNSDDQVYCVAEELFGDITINGDRITINFNDRTLNGHIIINGANAIVQDGKVIAPAPADNTQADAGVVILNTTASNVQLINFYVGAEDTVIAGVRGARALTNIAFLALPPDMRLYNCIIQGGNAADNGSADGGIGISGEAQGIEIDTCQIYGGQGSNSITGTIATGSGGRALELLAVSAPSSPYTSTIIKSSLIVGGSAGDMPTNDNVGDIVLGSGANNFLNVPSLTIIGSVFRGGSGGFMRAINNVGVGGPVSGGGGGGAIQITGNLSALINSEFVGGNAIELIVEGSVGVSGQVTLAAAGYGILGGGSSKIVINNCTIKGGNILSYRANNGAWGVGASVTTGSSGDGLRIENGSNVEAYNSSLTGGSIASLFGRTGIAVGADVVQGDAGDGVTIENSGKLNNCQLTGGSTGSDGGVLSLGDIGSATTTFTPGNAGNGCTVTNGVSIAFNDCSLIGGSFDSIRTDIFFRLINNIVAGRAGHGLQIAVQDPTTIMSVGNCQIIGGKANRIDPTGGGTIGSLAPVTGLSAGHGISVERSIASLTVRNTTITTYDGGDILGFAGGFSRTGGNGGIGINLDAVGLAGVIIDNCIINGTGRGGNVTVGVGGLGGNGGDGIFVGTAVSSAELSKNTIANTGFAGTPGVATSGKAINSLSASSGPSPADTMFIYGNFAHDIANAAPYTFSDIATVDAPAGTPFALAAGLNFLFNIWR